MSIDVHAHAVRLMGGPRHGEVFTVPDDRQTWYVPVLGILDWTKVEPGDPVRIKVAVYRRHLRFRNVLEFIGWEHH